MHEQSLCYSGQAAELMLIDASIQMSRACAQLIIV